MKNPIIKKCPHGGEPEWKSWEPFDGFEYKYLQCTKGRCEHGDWDCCSELFMDEDAVIIDWNRKMDEKSKKQED